MGKGVPLRTIMAQMPVARRKAIEAQGQELIAQEMALRELRRAMGRTQVEVGRKLGMKQDGVSKLERRTDMLLSTLGGYVEAVGGTLRLVAEFPDQPPVVIGALADVAPEDAEAS